MWPVVFCVSPVYVWTLVPFCEDRLDYANETRIPIVTTRRDRLVGYCWLFNG